MIRSHVLWGCLWVVLLGAPVAHAQQLDDWRTAPGARAEPPGGRDKDRKKKKKKAPTALVLPPFGSGGIGGAGLPLGLWPPGDATRGTTPPVYIEELKLTASGETVAGPNGTVFVAPDLAALLSQPSESGLVTDAEVKELTTAANRALESGSPGIACHLLEQVLAAKRTAENLSALAHCYQADGRTAAALVSYTALADIATDQATRDTAAAEAAALARSDVAVEAPPPAPKPWFVSPRVLVAGSVTAAAAAATTVFGIWTLMTRANYDNQNAQPCTTTPGSLESLRNTVAQRAAATEVLAGATVVGLGVTTGLVVMDLGRAVPAATGRLRVVPWVAGGSGGLVAAGPF